MANRARKLEVILAGDASSLQRSLARSGANMTAFGKKIEKASLSTRFMDNALGKSGQRMQVFSNRIKKLGRVATLGFVAIGAGVAAGLKFAVTEGREAIKMQALTDAVIKSTGGVANVTSRDIEKLTTKLSNLSGIDDELVQNGANLLLTFTNVRNEAGKGNKIFDLATAAALDMSVALGTDMKKSALQLGKALQDPTKGVTKLMRAGVTFTDQQKEQIKTLQESGDMLGAQKIILAEVAREFGGAAAAAATPMDRLKVTVNNLAEDIGKKLIPVIDKAAKWLAENLPKAMEKVGNWYDQHMKVPLTKIVEWLKDKIPAAAGKTLRFFQGAFEGGSKLIEDVAKAFNTNSATILKVLAGIGAALLLVAVAWNMGPGIIVTGVVLVGAALLYAYNKFTWFRTGVQTALGSATAMISAFISFIKIAWPAAWDLFGPTVSAAFKTTVTIIYDAIRYINDALDALFRRLSGASFSIPGTGISGGFGLNFTGGNVLPPPPTLTGGGHIQGGLGGLAEGGIVKARRGGTLALLGEGGRDEAVIPLGRGGGMGNVTIHIHAGLGTDPRVLERTVTEALLRYAKNVGGVPLKLRTA